MFSFCYFPDAVPASTSLSDHLDSGLMNLSPEDFCLLYLATCVGKGSLTDKTVLNSLLKFGFHCLLGISLPVAYLCIPPRIIKDVPHSSNAYVLL